jgi:hypothetical protein
VAGKQAGPLLGRWRAFRTVLFDPWNLILLVSSAFFFFIGQEKLPGPTNALLQTLLALCTGVLGGRITNDLASLAGHSVLEARARVAVRGLKLLLRNTSALEARIERFAAEEDHIRNNPAVTLRNYEEAIAICRLLQEETVSSIENWTDITPEANIGSAIGEITSLKSSHDAQKDAIAQLESSLKDVEHEYTKHKNTSVEQREINQQREHHLKSEIRLLRDSLATTKAQLEMAKVSAESGTLAARALRGNFAGNFANSLVGMTVDGRKKPTILTMLDPDPPETK